MLQVIRNNAPFGALNIVVPGKELQCLWSIIGFCFNIFMQMHRRKSWKKDSTIKAEEGTTKKKGMG
jgi:hypothetical protein